jgi:hypothetical protein
MGQYQKKYGKRITIFGKIKKFHTGPYSISKRQKLLLRLLDFLAITQTFPKLLAVLYSIL